MIDIHSHILPGLDDGAVDMETAVRMARQAVQDGITHLIATPHHGNRVYENEGHSVRAAVADLNERLQTEAIPLQVYPGLEVHTQHHWMDDLFAGKLLTLNDTRYILLEFSSVYMSSSFSVSQIDDIIHELRIEGLVPIIAHPERYPAFIKNPALLEQWIRKGALAQITAESPSGKHGAKIAETSLTMIRTGYAQIIASDAHNETSRAYRLNEAYHFLSTKLGDETVKHLQENAFRVLNNQDVDVKISVPSKKKWYFF